MITATLSVSKSEALFQCQLPKVASISQHRNSRGCGKLKRGKVFETKSRIRATTQATSHATAGASVVRLKVCDRLSSSGVELDIGLHDSCTSIFALGLLAASSP